ncbi:FAD-dependent monooxygenase [Hydrogenophilus thermoluteolus]|nr:FAD-dependent monooxygenase [Hydrogenophilus thermoluteolus]MBW7656979.1 FAD-dependent monooxygenase [Hydrogenophilus thermoluteolus]
MGSLRFDYDIIVHGGGLAGSSLALALGRAGWRVLSIEPNPPTPEPIQDPDQWQTRIYAFAPRPWGWLAGLQVFVPEQRFQPVTRMVVKGDAAGRIVFAADEVPLPYLAVIAEAETVRTALWTALHACATVDCVTEAAASLRACAVDWEGVTVEAHDGRNWRARLLVGAEGRRSWVRHVAGIRAEIHPYHHHAVVANFETEKGHDQTAFQWFREDGVLAYLPLPGNRVSIVWSTSPSHAEALLAMDAATLASTVAEAGERVLGRLSLCTPPQAFPLSLLRCERVVGKRTVVIGDAAHGIHPLSGHGINLGFNDAAELAALLGSAESGKDPGDPVLLARYERRRFEEPFLLQTVTDALAKGFAWDNPLLRWTRNCGMSLVDHLPFVKRRLVRYATLAQ